MFEVCAAIATLGIWDHSACTCSGPWTDAGTTRKSTWTASGLKLWATFQAVVFRKRFTARIVAVHNMLNHRRVSLIFCGPPSLRSCSVRLARGKQGSPERKRASPRVSMHDLRSRNRLLHTQFGLICKNVYIHTYLHMYVHTHACIHIYIYVYIYIFIHTRHNIGCNRDMYTYLCMHVFHYLLECQKLTLPSAELEPKRPHNSKQES